MSRFDILVDRSGMTTVKQSLTPPCVTKSGHVSMWGAEFEFPTAPFVVDAIVEWAKKGLYAYTVEDEAFREQVCWWMQYRRSWHIEPEWIVPVYGITSSLATAMRAFTGPSDGIIGMTPGYHMYWHAVELSGRNKIPTRLRYDGKAYSIDWDDLERKMAVPENKILLVCNPHNPLAKVFSREDALLIAELAEKHDVILFNDEIFAECLYEGVTFHSVHQAAAPAVKCITATSLGKWLSFTGTNQANLIISHEELRKAFLAERDREFYGSMNPMMVPAYRAAYTIEGDMWARDMMNYVRENYLLVDSCLGTRIPGFKAIRPEGTFILWVDATDFCSDAKQLHEFLSNKAYFHVDPGPQYDGDPGFFRMSLSIPRAELARNLQALEKAVRQESAAY